MGKKIARKNRGIAVLHQIIKPFYKVIYLFILFFILIGDSIRFVFSFLIQIIIRAIQSILYSVRSVELPSFSLPKLILPTITFPKITLPSITVPKVRLNIHLPHISLPHFKVKIPKISLPEIPKVTIPKIKKFPKIVPPHIVFPDIVLPHISPPHISLPGITTRFKYFFIGVLFALSLTLIQQSISFVKSLPNPQLIGSINYPLSTHLYDRNGKLLYEVYRDQNRTPIVINNLPAYVTHATIAIEDKDYYRHNGISIFSGIARAVKETVTKGDLQGGSTITQQLVKTALLSPERTLKRKIKEIILALWTEQLYSKSQILGMYLNQVAYGGASYGVEAASKTYFGVDAKDLTLEQAATLAGLPQAPSFYSPYSNPEAALARRNEVLKKMKEQGYISESEKNDAITKPLTVVPLKTAIKAPHFVFYVKQQLEEKYGTRAVEEGGLKVTTSLNYDIQQEAEKILREELDKIKTLDVTNGGILVTRPGTGEILAMVGSVDYFASPSGAFNVTTALRQPGSSIKPIMYSLALERGYTAATILDDTPVVYALAGTEAYRPVNYDGKFHGKIPLRMALANSYNIPAVRVLNSLGVDRFVDHAKNMGITTWGDSTQYGLSLTLGGGDVRMTDMAVAFGVFANQGYRTQLESIDQLVDSHGDVVYEAKPQSSRAVSGANSYIISDILSDNFARQLAFGPHSFLEIPGYKVAVKTGTTDNKKDNWTIGYTPEFLVAVWVGNNDGHPMNPILTSGITGAAPIWNRVMSYILKNYSTSDKWFPQPESIVQKDCYYGRKEVFIKGTDVTGLCNRKLLETSNPSTQPTPIN